MILFRLLPAAVLFLLAPPALAADEAETPSGTPPVLPVHPTPPGQ